jgi:O-antigen/teichoic acid export membrane protein
MIKLFYKLKNDPRIRNSLWMLIEKAISLFGLIFIISAVAKYTGPTIYGEIALAGAIFLVVKPIAQLGLDQIYFKYTSQKKPYNYVFLNNAIKLSSLIYSILTLLVLIFSYFYSSKIGFLFIFCTAVAYYFNTIDLRNFYFEGVLKSKFNVVANVIGLIAALILRYLIVILELDYLYLGIPIILMTLIPFFIKLYFYNKVDLTKDKSTLEKNKKYYKYFLGVGIPLSLSILASVLNSQVANYIIAALLGVKAVGYYSIAFVLAGAWCIVPTTLIMSYLTTIYKFSSSEDSHYIQYSRKIFYLVLVLSFSIVFILNVFSESIVLYLYGYEYESSIILLKILLWMQFFWVLSYMLSRLIIKFSGYRFLAIKTILCVILNCLLCFYFVGKYGVQGAAYAALLSELISFLFCVLYRKAYILEILLPYNKVKIN